MPSESVKIKAIFTPIENINITSIKINPSNMNMKAGTTVTLTATILPKNAANKKLIWMSDDSSIVTVTANDKYQGVVKGIKSGDTMISAMSWDGSIIARCNITVTSERPKPVNYTVTLDAAKYKISRYDSTKKKWVVLKTTTSTSYIDIKRSAGTSYKYRVSASNSVGMGAYSSTYTTVTKPVKPIVSLKKSGKDLKITWKKSMHMVLKSR